MAPQPNKVLLPAEQGIYTLLGFAQRAGKLYSGSDAVAQAVAKGQIKLVLLAWDLSENSHSRFRQRWQQLSATRQQAMQVWFFGSKEQLGVACGKPPRGIWGIGDESFCKGLIAKLEQMAALSADINGSRIAERVF